MSNNALVNSEPGGEDLTLSGFTLKAIGSGVLRILPFTGRYEQGVNSTKGRVYKMEEAIDQVYAKFTDLGRDLLELMYDTRHPIFIEGVDTHPLDGVVASLDIMLANPVQLYMLAEGFGLYLPALPYAASGYFYLSLKSILYGERHGKYPSYLPTPGDMYRFSRKRYETWEKSFWIAKKENIPQELLYRLEVDNIYEDRMSIYLYFSVFQTDQDTFEDDRISHHGEDLGFRYIESAYE